MTDQELKDLVASLEANGAKMDARFEKEVKEREKANREWHENFEREQKERKAEYHQSLTYCSSIV